MVANDSFMREGHPWQFSPWPGQVVKPHSIARKVISKLNWTKILVYSSALQCKKVQSSMKKFHWSKKFRKTENFSFNLNIRVPLESINLCLHVFLCLNVILTMEHYTKLLTIFTLNFAIFWSWQLALWNLGQRAPASFFYLQQAHGHHVWDIYIVDLPTYSVKAHLSRWYNSLLRWKRRLMSTT